MLSLAFLAIVATTVVPCFSNPVNQNQHCPVFQESESGLKVINLDTIKGQKVKLQFAYPNEPKQKSRRGNSAEKTLRTETETPLKTETEGDETTMNSFFSQPDIFCQWEFRTTNSSKSLLLTFDKMSAPNSENCVDSFIAMQKSDAFESRWCGKRKQARPMTLFSKGSARVSVFRTANAPPTSPTGFTLFIETVENPTRIEGGKKANALRVLLG